MVSTSGGFEHVAEVLLEVVCAPQLGALTLDDGERSYLPVGKVFGVLEQRAPASLDHVGPRLGLRFRSTESPHGGRAHAQEG